MKIKNILIRVFAVLAFPLFSGCSGIRGITVDPPLDNAAVESLLRAPSFTFIPQYVNPIGGRRRDLDAGYELTVLKDSLISYLPYFGRGYIAPLSPSDVDYDFTSTKFSYDIASSKKGWNISIKPTDQKYLRELYLRVFDNGSASLTATSLDRSIITYDGYIRTRKTKK